ncbi:uncharacterized protein LOC127245179 [Andrographis paniculata]|uniref:uncharacterized protein LOC127245179 n=1 Tax=Andrographis paniculata TaxID=175694 RepID=UPI0021E817EA|nr:uncharacterized protein LOC127245179 [Andrographis paniculata]XP_051121885.1 uncharacterized protein LOC127245179 [Andrographis paniculata]
MESAAVLRSFHYSFSTGLQLRTDVRKSGMVTMNNSVFPDLRVCGGKVISSTKRRDTLVVSCQKMPDATATGASNGDPNGAVLSDSQQDELLEEKPGFSATFPNGFESLLTEVCDETKIAELKVKFGEFEIFMKRSIDSPAPPAPASPQTITSPVPNTPTKDAAAAAPPPPPPKASGEKVKPFTNVFIEKETKLAALEASGATGYAIVSSPTVGSFRRARTLKGKKQPPACKEGDSIKEGQIIGFLDQFGTELPVKSDVAGEVLKLLYKDGEAVGYGDPLVAVLPSFHGINK